MTMPNKRLMTVTFEVEVDLDKVDGLSDLEAQIISNIYNDQFIDMKYEVPSV